MLDLVKGDDVLAVIQVGVDRIRNNDQFLFLADSFSVNTFSVNSSSYQHFFPGISVLL